MKSFFRSTECECGGRKCKINAGSNGDPTNVSDMAEGRTRSSPKKSRTNTPEHGGQGASTASTSSTLYNRRLPPLPVGRPSPGFREQPGVRISETNSHGARWMVDSERAQYWYEQYQLQKTESKHLNGVVKRL
jgi:hypothetical protein